jgi:MFS family permease
LVSALVESLKASDLHLSDAQAGSLMTGFVIVYMLASPVFGALGDRGPRARLIALGVGIWSLATALGGLAHSFASLFALRATVGIGEAAYGTIAPALLADHYPRTQRGRVFAIFFAAIPIGSALGYIVGGLVDRSFGWRAAFFVAGAPGLVLAALVARLVDPPRGAQDGPDEIVVHGGVGGYGALVRNRPYALAVLGYAAGTFAVGGLAFWMPAFLERVRGVPKAEATVQFGAIVVLTGLVGTFGGGWLGDYYLKRTRQAYLWVSGLTTLAAAPFTLLALVATQRGIYLPAIVVGEILLFASIGPINSAIVNLVAPGERATAVAASILVIHLFGDVPSPPLIGAISDASSLGQAVLIVPVAVVLGGAIWVWAAIRGEREDRR